MSGTSGAFGVNDDTPLTIENSPDEDRTTKSILGKYETTFELVGIIKAAIPKKARMEGGHPAKRVFQAIRIEVNNELGILENAIKDFVLNGKMQESKTPMGILTTNVIK